MVHDLDDVLEGRHFEDLLRDLGPLQKLHVDVLLFGDAVGVQPSLQSDGVGLQAFPGNLYRRFVFASLLPLLHKIADKLIQILKSQIDMVHAGPGRSGETRRPLESCLEGWRRFGLGQASVYGTLLAAGRARQYFIRRVLAGRQKDR